MSLTERDKTLILQLKAYRANLRKDQQWIRNELKWITDKEIGKKFEVSEYVIRKIE